MSNLSSHVRRVHKIAGFTAGRAPRKILGSTGESHRKLMAERAQAETEMYLEELSKRRGKKVTVQG
jgi:hypothetical protein